MSRRKYVIPQAVLLHSEYFCETIPVNSQFGPGDVGGKDWEFDEDFSDEAMEIDDNSWLQENFKRFVKLRNMWE